MRILTCLILTVVLAPVSSVCASGGGFERAVESAAPRTVRLYGAKAGLSAGYGSGVLISGDGLVVTVSSLLLDADRLRAVTADGTTYGADVLGTDDKRQLALLRLEPAPSYDRRGRLLAGQTIQGDTFPYFEPGDSEALRPGDWILAAGNPFKIAVGAEPVSVTVGVFSTRTRLDAKRKTRDFPYRGDVLVIDTITSNPGAPGGPLVDLDGQWVGLIGRVVRSNLTHTNFNYALPVEVVMAFVESVLQPAAQVARQPETRPEAYHGIELFELGFRKKMVYVDRVKRGSPARTAGLKKDDLIVSVDGRSTTNIEAFNEIMRTKAPGDRLDLTVIRDDAIKHVTLVLEEKK